MKVVDILTDDEEHFERKDLIESTWRTDDYILSIPHAGILIPTDWKFKYSKNKLMLQDIDMYTDDLYNTELGFILKSRIHRNVVDMNRPREGKSDSVYNTKMGDAFHGILLNGESALIQELSKEEEQQLLPLYEDYHSRLQSAIEKMKAKKGYALVFDCHSMNSMGLRNTPDAGSKRPDFDIGTLDDTSANIKIINTFVDALKKECENTNLVVAKNKPYKGGFITQKYSDVSNNVHVIQIEIVKKNYMCEGFEDDEEEFCLDKKRLNIIRSIVRIAMKKASETAEKIHG